LKNSAARCGSTCATAVGAWPRRTHAESAVQTADIRIVTPGDL
jgi:hypothetical protein